MMARARRSGKWALVLGLLLWAVPQTALAAIPAADVAEQGVPEVPVAPGSVTTEPVVPEATPAFETTWYTERIAERPVGSGATSLWSKGYKMRAETVVNGHPVITLVNGNRYYMIDGVNGAGWAVERHPAALDLEKKRGRPFGNEGVRMLEEGAEKVREERVMGQRCDVYRLTDRRGQREVWLTQGDPRVPVRLEVYNSATGKTSVTRYLGWVRDYIQIPDPFFEPDPRYTMEYVSYQEFQKRKAQGPKGMLPVLFPELLSGR